MLEAAGRDPSSDLKVGEVGGGGVVKGAARADQVPW